MFDDRQTAACTGREDRGGADLLRDREEHLRSLADSMSQLAWIAQADGYIIWYNRRWYEYTGTTPEQMEGWGWQSVHDPAVLPGVLERWRESIRRGTSFEMEFPLRAADGRFRWFLTRSIPVLDPEGRVALWFGTNTDVEDLREAREALRESNRRLALLAENADDMLKTTDPQEFLSRLFARLADYCGLEVCISYLVDEESGRLKLAFCSGVPEAELERLQWLAFGQAVCGTVARDRTRMIAEDIQAHPDDKTSLVCSLGVQAYCCHPLMAGGTLLGTLSFGTRRRPRFNSDEVELMRAVADQVATAVDRLKLVSRLEVQNGRLAKANRELEEFAYVASHDLREPLRMINVYTQLVLRRLGAGPGSELSEFAGFIQGGVTRLEMLIRDLLAFSRTVHAEVPEAAGSADLGAALSEALATLEGAIRETGAAITCGPLPVVRGEQSQLALVFQNLLSNALKYTRNGEPPRVNITSARQGVEWIVSVRDQGMGFEQSHAERIFGLFKRLHANDAYPGTGLGLAICRRILERYGGRIWAEGEPDRGAVFHVALQPAHGSAES